MNLHDFWGNNWTVCRQKLELTSVSRCFMWRAANIKTQFWFWIIQFIVNSCNIIVIIFIINLTYWPKLRCSAQAQNSFLLGNLGWNLRFHKTMNRNHRFSLAGQQWLQRWTPGLLLCFLHHKLSRWPKKK